MNRNLMLFVGVGLLFVLTGFGYSWDLSLRILIWHSQRHHGLGREYAMGRGCSRPAFGSVALGGLAVVVVGPASQRAGAAGGPRLLLSYLRHRGDCGVGCSV